ncbi:MAG: YkgJ family cysteine cluster protein [Acidimicrobiales bacterium]
MTDDPTTLPGDDPDTLPAGDFSSWVDDLRAALRGERPSVVPCNGCVACCTSSQFVLVAPDETETLRRIPKRLLFPAPRRPPGYKVLGYDERGHCPMLVDGRCSIYEHRPRTCRTYDCRVFAATGLDPGPGKEAIAERARRWRFDPLAREADDHHRAARAAAAFLARHRGELPENLVPADATQLSVVAVQIHHLFLAPGAPDLEVVRKELAALERLN